VETYVRTYIKIVNFL